MSETTFWLLLTNPIMLIIALTLMYFGHWGWSILYLFITIETILRARHESNNP